MSKRCVSPVTSSRKRRRSSRREESQTIDISDDDQCSSGSTGSREECDVIVIDDVDTGERKTSDRTAKSSSLSSNRSKSSSRSGNKRRVNLISCGKSDVKKQRKTKISTGGDTNRHRSPFKFSNSSSPPLVELDQEKKQATLDAFIKSSSDQRPGRKPHVDDNIGGHIGKISDLIDQICSLLSPHLEQSEMKVIAKVKKHHDRTMCVVKESVNGLGQVEKACTKCRLDIEEKPESCFTIVRVFLEQLEAIRMTTKSNVTRSSLPDDVEEVKPSTSKPAKSTSDNRPGIEGKRILKLEKTLRRLEREINRFELLEVDWDDDACSSYAIAARLKKRYVQVYSLYCELIDAQDQVDRVKSKRKIRFEGTRFPEVNARVEKFVNRTGCFPDYNDVLQEVCDANERHTLRMSRPVLEQVAEQAFHALGSQLQRNRRAALLETMDCLAGSEDWRKKDPAINNVQLRDRLLENADHAEKSISDVLEHYTRLQQERSVNEGEEEQEVADDSYDESEVTDEDVDPLSISQKDCRDGDKEEEQGTEDVHSTNGGSHEEKVDPIDPVVNPDGENIQDIQESPSSNTNEEVDSTT